MDAMKRASLIAVTAALVVIGGLCLAALMSASRQEGEERADGPGAEIARHLERLSSADAAARGAAVEALVEIGPPALFQLCPYIQRHLRDPAEHAWRAAYMVEERIALRYQADERLDDYYRTLRPARLPTMRARLPGGLTMELVRIPAGAFIQGSGNPGTGVLPAADMPCDYAPVRKVTIARAFWMGRGEVNQAQWESLMGLNRSREKFPHLAVELVSWEGALDFCRRLSRLNPPHRFTLPTEAQWEYACRAGTTSRHAFGNRSLIRGDRRLDEGGQWYENGFGLRHMHNSVFEWCLDWFGEYSRRPAVDPTGPAEGEYRAVRSNYRCCSAVECRSAHRSGFPPEARNGIGLRVVCPAADGR